MAKIVTTILSEFLPRSSSSVNITKKEKVITMEEVSWRYSKKDCWIIIYDRVYDVTQFLDEHPGGGDILLEYAGRDASGAFRGAGHSTDAIKSLEKYYIGELPLHERLFRKTGGFSLTDIPK